MSVIIHRSNKERAYKSLFVGSTSTGVNDNLAKKMTVLEELEKREKEIKSLLELSESLEERKSLRTELRDLRRKIFDSPTTTTTTTPTKTTEEKKGLSTNVKVENAKNIELNSNFTKNNNKEEIKTTTTTTTTTKTDDAPTKVKMSVARRSRIFDDNNNNDSNVPEKKTESGSLKLRVSGGEEVKTRDVGDRAVRRARRAQLMKEMSTDEGTKTNARTADESVNTSSRTSVVIEPPKAEPKEERKTSAGSSFKVNGGVGLKVNGTNASTNEPEKPNQAGTALRRTATWGHQDRTSASSTIGKALNMNMSANNGRSKFGAQAGPSPFQFGTDFTKKQNSPSVDEKRTSLSYNKYTPTVETVKTPTNAQTEHPTSSPTYNDTAGGNRRASLNKYNTPVFNIKDRKASTESAESSVADKKPEFALVYTPKKFTPSKDLMAKFEPAQKPVTSYNKYVAPISSNNNETGLNKVNRSFSMKVRPTYETNKSAVPEPSINFVKSRTQSANNSVTGLRDVSGTNSYNGLNRVGTNSQTGLNRVGTNSQTGLNRVGSNSNTGLNRVSSNNYTGLNRVGTTNSSGIKEESEAKRPTSSYSTNRQSTTSSALRNISSSPVEPPPPKPKAEPAADNPLAAFGGGAGDRMAFFRQAAQKEKESAEKKERDREERRKQQEMMNAALNGAMQVEKVEPKVEPKVEEKPEKKSHKKELTDSEKMKQSSAPCMKKREKKKIVRRTMSIGSIVLDWVQEMIKDYPVEVTNFSSSWNNGMAFCALIHHFNPEMFDYSELKPENKRINFDLAFETGMKAKNIPILLDTEDMVKMAKPEPRSVQTYIQWIWSVYGPTSGYGPTPKEVQS